MSKTLVEKYIDLLVAGKQHTREQRRKLYRTLNMIGLSLIWVTVLLFVVLKKSYFVSEWTLIVPGTSDGHAVTLESIGQATAHKSSAYASNAIDPIVNYKSIILSYGVLSDAASQLDLTLDSLGKPKIKIVDQTALMQLEIQAGTSEEARKRAVTIINSFQKKLEQLRDDEQNSINQANYYSLENFSRKLELAQQSKLKFQSDSGLMSIEQFNQMVAQLESDRALLNQQKRQLSHMTERVDSLKKAINLPEHKILQSINLKNDHLFQSLIKRHAEIHTQMSTIKGSWGTQHPKYQQLHEAHHKVNDHIISRGRKLTQNNTLQDWELIEMGSSDFENSTLQDYINSVAQVSSVQAEITTLEINISELNTRIEKSVPDVVTIEDLTRKQQVATAVFSTALAKQDISKADRFSSYPLVQVLTEPSLPEQPNTLPQKLALVGGVFTSLFYYLGLTLLWFRKPFLQKILKKD